MHVEKGVWNFGGIRNHPGIQCRRVPDTFFNSEPSQFDAFGRFLAKLSLKCSEIPEIQPNSDISHAERLFDAAFKHRYPPRLKFSGPVGVSPDSVTSGFLVTCCVSNRDFVLRYSHNCSVRVPNRVTRCGMPPQIAGDRQWLRLW